MINLTSSGGTITFAFDNNSGYLQNGTIEVPVNSLSLVIDESDMVTFKKANSNDVFVSALASDFGMTKAQLISFYKDNMVGSTGGGTDTGTVQTMIDESISGKADTSAVTESINAAVSGKADAASAVTNVRILTVSQQNSLQIEQRINNDYQFVGNVYKIGSGLTWDYSTKEIEVDNSTVALKTDLSGKADTSATTVIMTESGTVDGSTGRNYYTAFTYSDGVYYLSGNSEWLYDNIRTFHITYSDGTNDYHVNYPQNTGDTDNYTFTISGDNFVFQAKGIYKIKEINIYLQDSETINYSYKYVKDVEKSVSAAILELDARVRALEEAQNNS